MMRSLYLLPLVLLSACGSRQPAGQAPMSQTMQPASQPAAVPQAVAPAPAPYQAVAPQAEYMPPQAAPINPSSADRRELAPATGEAVKPSPLRPSRSYDESPERASIAIPAGTVFDVRLDDTLDTRRNRSGDAFSATLMNPIFVNRRLVVPRGTACSGHITESMSSGRFKGRAVMGLSLDSFEMNGRRYRITTTHVGRRSSGHKKRNWFLIGGGSGLGSAIGAIAAGPAGALIGAGAGAAAGTTGAALTGRRKVHLAAETPLAFSLRTPVRIAD